MGMSKAPPMELVGLSLSVIYAEALTILTMSIVQCENDTSCQAELSERKDVASIN